MKKMLKRMISCGMTLALVFAMSITSFAQAENKVLNESISEVQAVQPRATYQQNVVAVTQEWQGEPFTFSGTKLTVAVSGFVESGSASSVKVQLRKKNWLNQYKPVGNPVSFTPNGDTVTILRDVDISSGGNYCFSYQVSGSSDASVRVILTAVTY